MKSRSTHFLDWDLPTAASRVAEGLPTQSLEDVRVVLDLSKREFADVIQISERTLTRRQKESVLPADESDRVFRFARLIEFATLVLGDESEAREWMKEPNYALGNSTPLQFAKTEPGAELVEQLLGRIDHGIPA
ncbi:MAG: DUF2384 domain-containing protein [Bacteroidetes bacterium]|nr:DUF2384 domain-containing protein [Bacteroidota bacterium]